MEELHSPLSQQTLRNTMEDLPDEVLEFILGFLPPYRDLQNCMAVSKRWYNCGQSELLSMLFIFIFHLAVNKKKYYSQIFCVIIFIVFDVKFYISPNHSWSAFHNLNYFNVVFSITI